MDRISDISLGMVLLTFAASLAACFAPDRLAGAGPGGLLLRLDLGGARGLHHLLATAAVTGVILLVPWIRGLWD